MRSLIAVAFFIILHTHALAAVVTAQWVYKISVIKGAPTPDMATKAIATAGSVFGAVTVAQGADAASVEAKGFALRSNIKVATLLSMLDSNLNMVRQSSGLFVNNIASTQRYSDKRGSTPELLMAVNPRLRQLTFSNGPGTARSEAMKTEVVDLAMLPYAFIGRPAPKAATPLVFTDGKMLFTTLLSPRHENVKVAGQLVPAVRLTGTAAGGSLDLWVRATDSYPLVMRIGLDAKYGLVLEQEVQAVPATLVMR
jgi:hypothetical protein